MQSLELNDPILDGGAEEPWRQSPPQGPIPYIFPTGHVGAYGERMNVDMRELEKLHGALRRIRDKHPIPPSGENGLRQNEDIGVIGHHKKGRTVNIIPTYGLRIHVASLPTAVSAPLRFMVFL